MLHYKCMYLHKISFTFIVFILFIMYLFMNCTNPLNLVIRATLLNYYGIFHKYILQYTIITLRIVCHSILSTAVYYH